MDLMIMMLMMMMLPNLLSSVTGFFGGNQQQNTAPQIYFMDSSGPPPPSSTDTSYTATWNEQANQWTYVPTRPPDQSQDNPFDLAVGGAIVGAGLGLAGGPFAPITVPAGIAIGAGLGFLADLFF